MTNIIEADRYTTDIMREGLGTELVIPPPDDFQRNVYPGTQVRRRGVLGSKK